MPYRFTYGSPSELKEKEFAIEAQEIKFAFIDSCLGVVLRSGDRLSAVHLVRDYTDPDTKGMVKFDQNAATKLMSILPSKFDECTFVGQEREWDAADGPTGFSTLRSALQQNARLVTNGKENRQGLYTATVSAKPSSITNSRIKIDIRSK